MFFSVTTVAAGRVDIGEIIEIEAGNSFELRIPVIAIG